MSDKTFIDPRNKYGIRGYNGLFLKICKLVYPDRMGCGAEKSCDLRRSEALKNITSRSTKKKK